MRLVLLGPPGAGKGTQALLIAQRGRVPHISTGDILRESMSAGTPLGLKVKSIVDSGELVPDAVVIDLVKERLGRPDCTGGFLLDGFPRTVDQARALTTVLADLNRPLTHVVNLNVPEATLLERIRNRGLQGSGRADDSLEVAAKRLKVYWEQTAPVAGYYRDLGQLVEIDGLGTVDEVTTRLSAVLGL